MKAPRHGALIQPALPLAVLTPLPDDRQVRHRSECHDDLVARDEEQENLEGEHRRLVREMEEKGLTEPPWQIFLRIIVRDAGPYLVAPVVLGLIVSLLSDFGGSIDPRL